MLYRLEDGALIDLPDYILDWNMVGSRSICDPPPTDTDRDILVLVKDYANIDEWCTDNGWALGGSKEDDPMFASYRKGIDNLLVTTKKEFFDQFWFCNQLAKKLNLLKKQDRITLFQAIRDGVV